MDTNQLTQRKNTKKTVKAPKEPEIIQNATCLMLEFSKFNVFTHRRNFKCLIELCKKLRVSIAVVRVVQAELASLKEIADLLNNNVQELPMNVEFKKLRYRLLFTGDAPTTDSDTLDEVQIRKQRIKEIKQIVRNEILKSDIVTTSTLSDVLAQYSLSKSQLRYYLNTVKKTMELEGYSFQ